MNRYSIHILLSAFLILMPLGMLIYMLWLSDQPRTGPVGNGDHSPSFLQLVPFYCTALCGIINLPIAIHRYLKHKKSSE